MKNEYWEYVWSVEEKPYASLIPTNELPWEINTYDPNLPRIFNILNNKTGKMLDVGCGSGDNVNFFSLHGYDACGMDISKTAIKLANKKFPNLKFKCKDILRDDNIGKNYNIIFDRGFMHNMGSNGILNEVIVRKLFLKFSKILSDNGEMIIISGNSNQIGTLGTTQANKITISDIERNCSPMFKIKYVEEIVFKQNINYGDALGWLFLLEKV